MRVILALFVITAAGCGPVWDTYRGGPGRAGALRPTLAGPPHGRLWERELSAPSFSSPVLGERTLLVGSSDDYLNILDPWDGRALFRIKTGGDVSGSAAPAGGLVYFGSADGFVYAADPARGTLRWKFKADNKILAEPAVAGKVYFATLGGTLYALEPATGKEKWSARGLGPVWTTPCVSEKRVWVAARDGRLRSFDAASGRPLGAYDAGAPLSAPPLALGDAIYVATDKGEVRALDAATLRDRWTYAAAAGVSGFAADGTALFAADWDGQVVSLGLNDGRRRWAFDAGSAVEGCPAIAAGLVYVGTAAGKLYALDAFSGAVRWETDLGAPISSTPTVGSLPSRGTPFTSAKSAGWALFVVADDGKVAAYGDPRP